MEKKSINNRFFWSGFILVLLFSIGAFVLKYNDFKNGRGEENVEATYHTLLVINSLSSLPISESALLPTVNFNGENNKNIPWAAAIKTNDGNYVYTSFPSLGFVAPYIALRALNAELSLKNLYFFNSGLSALTALIFFTVLYLSTCGVHSEIRRSIAALAGCSVLIYSCESLVSSGLVYWPHSLSQLIISVILLLFIIRTDKNKNIVDALLFFSLLAFSMTEWTGYVFCALLTLYSLITRQTDWKRISLLCIMSSLIAVVIFAIQIEMVITLKDFLRASMDRFATRSASKASFIALLNGYWVSFGLYLLLIIPGVVFLKDKKYRFLLVLCALPMFENIILAQHATAYTFDRWKLAFFIGASISFVCVQSGFKQVVSVALVILSIVTGVMMYHAKVNSFSDWAAIDKKNRELVAGAAKVTNFGCAELFSDARVRGYTPLLFMRGVYEGLPTSATEVMNANPEPCSVVIIHSSMPEKDLPGFTSIEVWNRGAANPVIIK
ncbi:MULTISPECIES: hypothetical protein [Enterobacteriaceae]|uniref:hypothetical protein n=1 Tax=Enterobacteriaceae TaxID=543 RepID=UPI002FF7D6C7